VPYNGYVGLLLFLTDRGRLKTSSHPAGNYKPMLPKNENDKDCHGDDRTVFCFKAGKHSLRPTINVSTRVSALAKLLISYHYYRGLFDFLFIPPYGSMGGYLVYCVCNFFDFFCTVTDYSAAEKDRGVKFCTRVRLLSGQVFSLFGELWFARDTAAALLRG